MVVVIVVVDDVVALVESVVGSGVEEGGEEVPSSPKGRATWQRSVGQLKVNTKNKSRFRQFCGNC